MRILLTNIWLDNYAGTEVYVRDLAIELKNRGVEVEVYSPILGRVASEIKAQGIEVYNDPKSIKNIPDLIHGHQFLPTMNVLDHFRKTPAVYFLHDRTFPGDTPPALFRIMKYVAVDQICAQKLLEFQIPPKKIETRYNWVDTNRFYLKSEINAEPRKALVFSNYAHPGNHFEVIKRACEEAGLELDVIGTGFQNSVVDPQHVITNYDIIFAKGKAAIEGLASGAAVIVCDFRGLGGMVLPQNYRFYRQNNFGMNTMKSEIEIPLIHNEIRKYDKGAIEQIAFQIRRDADFNHYVNGLMEVYEKAVRRFQWIKWWPYEGREDIIFRAYRQTQDAIR